MNIDNKLDKLKNIRPVDAPAFLYTRIKQQLENLADAPAPVKWRLAFITAALFILLLNAGILTRSSQQQKTSDTEQLVNSMQLSSSNDFYHD
jgi:hypothetical protein